MEMEIQVGPILLFSCFPCFSLLPIPPPTIINQSTNQYYQQHKQKAKIRIKTYNSEDSLVVTHPTTNSPACGLSTAERTGSPVFHTLWSYVSGYF
ncbi:uncharacterized protein N7479_005806 [Penicillium vulpinum]|uniref:uncharacterized protein n=1 Tax=Penicillium vulpinum TaxID=29845 RepID=UPI002548B73A|nr:uncharacterized protein N7479_005806 [Penicillium vulpinum]KAJ5958656.1 hypothetical protein N7479_005806 [Penicillium vulpinum]